MRILNLIIHNLNSLRGRWSIDFQNPEFQSAGIFAITGPTGAGKSTILDAICLALYGRTPRLSQLSQSQNEIMSRHTGFCSAEVTFQTPSGIYRCSWHQKRARKKIDGALQASHHEIVDASNDKVLEHRKKNVLEKVEEVTGMDYERFSRSMLLAQGGFSAFLNAKASERSPLLEQITGTEIYSLASQKVFEITREEQQKLQQLQAELQGMSWLQADEVAALEQEQKELVAREKPLVKHMAEIRQNLQDHQTLATLQEEQRQLVDLHTQWQKDVHDFQIHAERLQLDERSRELHRQYEPLLRTRQQVQHERQRLKQNDDSQQKLNTMLQEHQLQSLQQQQQSEAFKQALVQRETLWSSVERLDLLIQQQCEHTRPRQEQLQTLEQKLTQHQEQLGRQQAEHQQGLQTLQKSQAHLDAHPEDKLLVDQLSGWLEQIKRYRQQQREIHSEQTLKAKLSQQKVTLQEKLKQQQEAFEKGQAELLEVQQQFQHWQEEHQALVAHQDHKQQLEIKQQIHQNLWKLEQVKARAEQCQNMSLALHQQGEICEQQESKLLHLGKALEQHQTVVDTSTKTKTMLEEQRLLEQKIQSLEQHRLHLESGEACPLCGSTEHPYANTQGLPPAEAEDQLKQHLQQHEALLEQAQQLQKQSQKESMILAKHQGQREQHQEKLQEELEHLQTGYDQLLNDEHAQGFVSQDEHAQGFASQDENAQGFASQAEAKFLSFKPSGELTQEIAAAVNLLLKLEQAWQKEHQNLQQWLEQHQTSEKLGEKLQLKLSPLKDEQLKLEHQLKLQGLELKNLDEATEQNQQKLHQLEQSSLECWSMLKQHLSPWLKQGDSPRDEELEACEQQLQNRRQQWCEHEELTQRLEKDKLKQIADIEQTQQIIEQTQSQKREQEQELQQLTQKLDEWRKQRHDLAGDLTVADDQAQWKHKSQHREQQLEQAKERHQKTLSELQSLQHLGRELQQELREHEQSLLALENTWSTSLLALNYSDEQDYLRRRLDDAERQQRQSEQQELKARQTSLRDRQKQCEERLQTYLEKVKGTAALEELQQDLEAREKELQQCQQQLGAVVAKLEQDRQLRQQQAEQLKRIDAQQNTLNRWDKLNQLMGSSSGSKFRNFAQGLTFELMVHYANQQLCKMSDRYLLIHDRSEPLELQVIDQHQAGDIRSTKNLSGGESFLVSLALALGLANMSSKNIQIDSLFLDEGFGTLDEDALDTAIETLASLKHEQKVIGVISHIPALKNRITTQIQVEPIPGVAGRSRLLGPGCLAEAQK